MTPKMKIMTAEPEADQEPRPLTPSIPARPAGRPKIHLRPAAADKATLFYVFQWKDQLDPNSPWLKQLFFWLIYRPFNQFCRFTLHLPTFNAEQCKCGAHRLLWTEHQGVVAEEYQAAQAAETPNWGYHELPYNGLLSEATVADTINHNYPLTDERTQGRYRNGNGKVEVGRFDLVKLASKIAATDNIVARHQSKVT